MHACIFVYFLTWICDWEFPYVVFFTFPFQTGGDGCICYLEYDKDRESLEFIGMKQVKELSLIQSVSAENNSIDLASCNYAAGFASTDFIIWNLITEAKVNSSVPLLNRKKKKISFAIVLLQYFWCLRVDVEVGCANSMWWMAAPSFLLSWWCTRDKELFCICQGEFTYPSSNISLVWSQEIKYYKITIVDSLAWQLHTLRSGNYKIVSNVSYQRHYKLILYNMSQLEHHHMHNERIYN